MTNKQEEDLDEVFDDLVGIKPYKKEVAKLRKELAQAKRDYVKDIAENYVPKGAMELLKADYKKALREQTKETSIPSRKELIELYEEILIKNDAIPVFNKLIIKWYKTKGPKYIRV